MPFEGEHAARQRSPSVFDAGSLKRFTDTMPEGVALIMGTMKGKEKQQVQSVRFNADKWTAGQAQQWLKDNRYKVNLFEEAVTKAWSVSVPISKLADEKRLAFGWASVVIDDDGQAVIDHQQDRISIPELEKAAYEYVQKSRQSTEMHTKKGVAELVESVVMTPEKREAMGIATEGISGWWVGFRVNDQAVWSKVKAGEYSEFSIGGTAKRKEVQE